ncbi:MAG TPA: lamin tail domain-containing protein [Sedimentisphaerales bacterium]|nr:lamin tail domain-containing protein [Sedimentisphaerales bacterium]
MGDSSLRRLAVLSILLGLVNVAGAFALKVDIGADGQPVKPGWQEFSGGHTVGPQYREFLVDGITIGVDIRIGNDNGAGYRNYGGGLLGGDMVYPDDDSFTGPIDGSVIMTISNLPAANYNLISYHNDSKDSHLAHGLLNVTVAGAVLASTDHLNVQQTQNLTDDNNLGQSTVTFTAGGTGAVVITYAPVSFEAPDPRAVLSGFELELSGPIVPTVEFETTASQALESVDPALLAVTLSPSTPDVVTVDYAVVGGTATPGDDFILASGTLTFDANQTTPETISIQIINDGTPEQDETIIVELSGPENAELGANYQHTYTIVDPRPAVSFELTGSEGEENISPASIAVRLSEPSSGPAAVNYSVTGGTATPGIDFVLPDGALNFEPNETTKQITFSLTDDGLAESPDETIVITLSDPVNAKLGGITQHIFTILPPIPIAWGCPDGDVDGNCEVDALDLRILAQQWLEPGGCSDPNCADVDGSLNVDFGDFSFIAKAWLIKGSPIVINELMAANRRTQTDPDEPCEDPNVSCAYPDWVELYNLWETAISLEGMYLTDDLAIPTRWQIPVGVTIEGRGYLVFWADNDVDQGDTHTNFRLDAGGEVIALFGSDGQTLIDIVDFRDQPQTEDVSYGRFPDGSDNRRQFDMCTDPHPTPGQANRRFDIVISEIMYHPSSENDLEEYIELFNRGDESVNMLGWKLTDGVLFDFPDVTIGPGEYLVVCANMATFSAKYPSVVNVVGNWLGKLSNKSECIELVGAAGTRIDQVCYADEGDWSVRLRGPYDHGHYGWVWSDEHDGGGKSLELINPEQTNWYGQNWTAATVDQGTPGAQNSVMDTNTAPLIIDIQHSPTIPGPSDPVTLTARIIDKTAGGITAKVYYRVDGTGLPFSSLDMYDDGLHADGGANDETYGAQIPAQSDLSVVECYVEASDEHANTRTWPAAVPTFGQVANVLYQVNSSYDPEILWAPGSQPIYHLILTAAEKVELHDIGDASTDGIGEDQSNAQMNATFMSRDAAGMQVRYNVGVRNRGHGSRHEPPMNYRVNFAHDRPWNNVTAINLNSKFAHLQWLGAATFQAAGMPAMDVTIVQVRVNGQNMILSDSDAYGSYAYNEVKDSDWAENHFPADADGNIYLCMQDYDDANLTYEGPLPDPYRNSYFKQTNEEYDDWSDLINMTYVINNAAEATYLQDISQVIDVQEWMRYLALDALLINCESGLNTGEGDDYALYSGVSDPRFLLVNHDMDTYLRQGDHSADCDENHDIFIFRDVDGLSRMLNHPDVVPLYYQAYLDLIDTIYNPDFMNPLIDDGLGGYVPSDRRDAMKQVIVGRTAGVLAQIPYEFTINSSLPIVSGFHYTTAAVTTLDGTANAAETRSVLVDGVLADWSPVDGVWSVASVALNPGINRIVVEAFDDANGLGSEVANGYVDIWYDDGSESYLSGVLGANTVLSAASGPWHVTADVTVPPAVTLTIEAGTTVFFDSATGILVNGRLVADGTRYERVRLTRVPAGSSWDGLAFANSQHDSRLASTDMDFGDAQGESISISSSQVLIDEMTWAGTNSTILELSNPYLIVSNSTFPSLNGSEVIHGAGMPASGYFILEGCTFGASTGNADVIDFSGGKRPGPILQAYDNVFLGGEDDALDLDGTDAHIEGNIFMNFHFGGGDPTGTSNPIATGEATDVNSQITAVRNIFYNNDHAALLKENCFMHAENNVIYGCTSAAVNFDEPGHASSPGAGVYMDGNIFWNNTDIFQNFYPQGDVTVNRSILPTAMHYLGSGNIDATPLLADPDNGDFTLLPGSPAKGTGPNGLDIGAMVPAGASITGEPPEVTYQTSATLHIGGPGIIAYRYALNDDPNWSAEYPVDVPIELTGLSDGVSYTVYVIGKNSAGVWQSDAEPAVSRTWTIDLGAGLSAGDVVINELLAHSNAAPYFDWVELHNATNVDIDIGGWFLSDSNSNLMKYQIAEGTILAANGYIILREDVHFGPGSADPGCHVPFALSENGETLYLSSGLPGELTLTEYREEEDFGASAPDVAFGRYYKASTDTWNFVAMSENTPGPAYQGAPNAYPKVGPVVISEIMYHPQFNADAEYVELLNISGGAVTLYDFTTSEPWKFADDGGFEFFFPAGSPVAMANGERILLVKNLTAFSSEFVAPGTTQIFEWGLDGSLSNGGEKIQLSMPGDVDGDGVRQYIRIDRVNYSDGDHPLEFPEIGIDPWPSEADGNGKSLTRIVNSNYGNDPINWEAADPTPGQ